MHRKVKSQVGDVSQKRRWQRFRATSQNLAIGIAFLLAPALIGCVPRTEEVSSEVHEQAGEKKAEPKAASKVKRVPVGKNVSLEIDGAKRRVRIEAEVCLRKGLLEQLLTKKRTKEHEAVLAADIDGRELHLALTLAGAEAGTPVQFRPKVTAPTGTLIKIYLEYKVKGKDVRVPAQQWIRSFKTKKDFPTDWVFAGSTLTPNPEDKKKPYYGANVGDMISVVNFETSCLDVPFVSTKDNDDLAFEAHTERIPAKGTPVTLVLEPVAKKKK
ncbi:MAG: hypothetical protein HYX68_05620 [Planctomycetes bacterium]|nr:hypothetical protein [Planctomycetota bacterium]